MTLMCGWISCCDPATVSLSLIYLHVSVLPLKFTVSEEVEAGGQGLCEDILYWFLTQLPSAVPSHVRLMCFCSCIYSQSKPNNHPLRRLPSRAQMLDGLRRRHASRPSSRPLSLNFSTFSAPPPSPDMESSSDHPIRRWGWVLSFWK